MSAHRNDEEIVKCIDCGNHFAADDVNNEGVCFNCEEVFSYNSEFMSRADEGFDRQRDLESESEPR